MCILKIESMKGLKTCVFPGMSPLKQFELYKKRYKHLPDSAKGITCPKPTDEIMDKSKI